MRIRVDPTSPPPLFAQIAAGVRRELVEGRLTAGDRLPAAREVARSLDVNLHTVLRAYQELREEELVDLRRGRARWSPASHHRSWSRWATRFGRWSGRPVPRDGRRHAGPRRRRGPRAPRRGVAVAAAGRRQPLGPERVDGTQSRVAFTATATVLVLGPAALLAAVAWVLPRDGRRLMATLGLVARDVRS